MTTTFKNSYKVQDKRLVSLSVYNVGFQKCESLYRWGPGVRDHFLIHYVVSGKGYYRLGSDLFSLQTGDIFLVYPDTEITYFADGTNPWEYYWVGFSGSDAEVLISCTDFHRKSPVIHQSGWGKEIQKHIYRIYQSRGSQFANAVQMAGELYLTLAVMIRASSRSEQHSPNISLYLQKSLSFITANYASPITVEDIAAYAGISRSHLYREFQAHLAQSPKEYLTEFRIRRAKQLLRDSELSLTAIANSIGYDNSLYFSKAFHKVTGSSPSEYKRLLPSD